MARGGAESRVVVWNKSEAHTSLFELAFEDNAGFLDVAGTFSETVSADTERNFTFVVFPGVGVVLNNFHTHTAPVTMGEFRDDFAGFLGATKSLKIKRRCVDDCRLVGKPCDVGVESFQLGNTDGRLASQNRNIHTISIY